MEGEAVWEAGLSGGWGEEEGVGSGGGRGGLSDGFRRRGSVGGRRDCITHQHRDLNSQYRHSLAKTRAFTFISLFFRHVKE